jgi:hypothetical protein
MTVPIAPLVSWEEVSDQRVSADDLVSLVSGIPAATLLEFVSAISVIRTNAAGQPAEIRKRNEMQCLRELCSPDIAARAIQHLRTGQSERFLWDEQLLLAAKLAVQHGSAAASEDTEEGIVGKLLLQITEVLSHDLVAIAAQPDRDLAITIRGLGMSLRQQARYLIARSYDLYVTRSRASRREPHWQSLADAFTRKTGMSIRRYMAFALLYYLAFGGVESVPQFMTALARAQELESLIASKRVRRDARRNFSRDLLGFRRKFVDQPAVSLSQYRPFQLYPLVQMEDGTLLPVSLLFLLDKLSIGLYRLLHIYFSDKISNGVSKLTSHIGTIFEGYSADLLSRIYDSDGPGPFARFYDQSHFIYHPPKKRQRAKSPFDAAVVEGPNLMLLEIFSGTLRATTLESGNPKYFEADIRTNFRKKFRQLWRSVLELASGLWEVQGLDLSSIRHVYPVLVLLHPFPQSSATWQRMRTVIGTDWPEFPGGYALAQGATPAIIHPPQILTAEELEMLEPDISDGSRSLSGILGRKLNDPQYAQVEMKAFLYSRPDFHERLNEHMHALYDHAFEQMRLALGEQVDLETLLPG